MADINTIDHIKNMLIEQNPVGLFYLNNDVIQFANDAFATILAIPLENILGKSLHEFITKKSIELLNEKISILKKSAVNESLCVNVELKKTSKETVYFSLHLKTIQFNNNNIEIAGASRIVTQRIYRFEELEATKTKFENLYENKIFGVVIYDFLNEKFIDANITILKKLGFENDFSSFKRFNRFSFIPKTSKYFPGIDIHEVAIDHCTKVIKGESFYSPGIFYDRKGKQMLMDVNIIPTGNSVGEAFVIFQDVTEKVLSQKAVKKSEQKYRNIFNNSHEGILYFNLKNRKIEICNQNALQILGVDSIGTLRTLAAKDFYYDKKIKDIESTKFTLYMFKCALKNGRTEITFKLKQQTGDVIWVSAVLISERSNKNRPYIIIFLRNITDLYEAQDLLNQKNKELQKYIDSNLQLENFAYLASHDLQTPLRSIMSFTQLLQLKLLNRLSEEEQAYMNFVISATQNMKDLVNDLLSYASINEAKINIKEIKLNELLTMLLLELNSEIISKKAIVELVNIPENIHADPIKIRQVFQNLIANAIKFSRRDCRPTVMVKGVEQEKEWRFFIQDNGIGIEPEYMDKIFLMFKRLHGAQYEGTGIGLAVVKKIIDQHKGRIWVDSQLEEGTTFWFTIPKQITTT